MFLYQKQTSIFQKMDLKWSGNCFYFSDKNKPPQISNYAITTKEPEEITKQVISKIKELIQSADNDIEKNLKIQSGPIGNSSIISAGMKIMFKYEGVTEAVCISIDNLLHE